MTLTLSSRPMKKIAYIFAATALMALAVSCEKEMETTTVTDDSAAVRTHLHDVAKVGVHIFVSDN